MLNTIKLLNLSRFVQAGIRNQFLWDALLKMTFHRSPFHTYFSRALVEILGTELCLSPPPSIFVIGPDGYIIMSCEYILLCVQSSILMENFILVGPVVVLNLYSLRKERFETLHGAFINEEDMVRSSFLNHVTD